MILSTSKKFIFVHIPKTAGLAVTDALGAFGRGYERSLLRSLSRRLPFRESPESAHFREHEPARTMVRKLGRDVFDQFTSFSVIRNPFDHAVSHYEYMKQFRIASTARKVGRMSFREYLDYRQKPPFWNDTIFARLPDQTYFVTDDAGNVVVDRFVHFERLNDELMALADDLGLEGVTLRHVNRTKSKSDKKPFQDYYDAETEEIVRTIYDRDFETFGYSREMPARQPSE